MRDKLGVAYEAVSACLNIYIPLHSAPLLKSLCLLTCTCTLSLRLLRPTLIIMTNFLDLYSVSFCFVIAFFLFVKIKKNFLKF